MHNINWNKLRQVMGITGAVMFGCAAFKIFYEMLNTPVTIPVAADDDDLIFDDDEDDKVVEEKTVKG